jgi:hypothetical protein
MLSSEASAGAVLSSFIINPGGSNTLTDNSVSKVVFDAGGVGTGAGILSNGDIVQGILRIDQTTSPLPGHTAGATDQLLLVFSFKIAPYSGPPAGPGNFQDLVPVTPADGAFTLKDMLPTLLAPYSQATLAGGLFALVEASSATNLTAGPLGTGLTTIDSSYLLDLVGGDIGATDFLQAKFDSAVQAFPAYLGGILVDIGNERGGLSVIDATNNSGFAFSPTTPVLPYSNLAGDITLHDFGFLGQLRTLSTAQFLNGYDVADKADVTFTATPTPEPATLGMFGLLLSGVLAVGRERRGRQEIAA